MSRSWGRAHLRWLLREPRARPLPGAALSRVTAAEVVGSSRLEAETHGLTARETRRHEGGARSARPTPEPSGTAPAPTCARTRGQVSRQRRARSRRPPRTARATPPLPLSAHRVRPAGRLCNRAGPLASAPCPAKAACGDPAVPGNRGRGRASAAGCRSGQGAAAGLGGGLRIQSSVPEAVLGSEVSLIEGAGLQEPLSHSWWLQVSPS